MHTLEQMFPSLTLFSDLNWDLVTKEYESEYIDISFPEYLQQKSLDGDCPPYLFELAYYELALFDVKTSTDPYPHQPGVYLNPTALFLSLEFDVKKMLEDAKVGKIDVIEKSHVICLFRDTEDKIHIQELTDSDLDLLQFLEDGPQPTSSFVEEKHKTHFDRFCKSGLILAI